MDPYSPSSASFQPPVVSSSQAVSQAVVDQLASTKPWVRFMSVLMFVGAGFLVIGAIAMLIMGTVAASAKVRSASVGTGMSIGIAAFYIILAVLYIFPALKLWKYASRIADLTRSYQEFDLVTALSEQRSFWKFAGIATIVFIVLYFVAIGAAIVGAAALRM